MSAISTFSASCRTTRWRIGTTRARGPWPRNSPTCTTVRLRWLKHAAPELVGEIQSFPRAAQPTRRELEEALRSSERAVAVLLEECEAKGSVTSWNGSPATMLGYLTAHEAHHRALVMVATRLSGHRLPQEVAYGQWQWGKKRRPPG